MDKKMSDMHFRLMTFAFSLRDMFLPRKKILGEVAIERGLQVLDYGCGPGGYSIAAAKIVGETGMVYALDIQPLAVRIFMWGRGWGGECRRGSGAWG